MKDEEEDKCEDEFLRLSRRAFFISSTCFTSPAEEAAVVRGMEMDRLKKIDLLLIKKFK